jgi:hypothetical protein
MPTGKSRKPYAELRKSAAPVEGAALAVCID